MSERRILLISAAVFSLLGAVSCTRAAERIIYVDNSAIGTNDGTSWENAYIYLQEALADANDSEKHALSLSNGPVEIRVARGVYKPDGGIVAIPEFDWRTLSFQLISGVSLKGGYAGVGSADPNERDVELYKTILSGDLNSDDAKVYNAQDMLDDATRTDNSYHVLTAYDIDPNATLDGFTITGGNADDEQEEYIQGGGIHCENSSIIVTNCIFQDNASSDFGGAIYNDCSKGLAIQECKFIHNASNNSGGAMFNGCSNPTLKDCIFRENFCSGSGGAIITYRSAPLLINCIFEYNKSDMGGGIYNFCYGDPVLINCTFISNSTTYYGGGIYNKSGTNGQLFEGCIFKDNFAVWYGGGIYNTYNSDPVIKNCLFTGNSTDHWGGALHFHDSNAEVINCTIADNYAQKGGAIGFGREDEVLPSDVKITNNIIWNNADEIYNHDNSLLDMLYTCLQVQTIGRIGKLKGNINQDPCFVEPGFRVNANDPNQIVRPDHPNAVWVDGDYHLKSQMGRWEPNSGSWVIDDVTSPCIDVGDPNSPVGDEPEPNGGRINMGAYGGTAEASKSYLSEP